MRTHTFVRWFGVAGAAAVLLTACSSGDKDDAKSDTKRVTMASLMGAPDYENVDYDALQLKQEEAVAKCMIAEGWEYIPVKYPDQDMSVEYSEEDEVERITREGLGITYYLLNDGSDTVPSDDPWANFVDPNQEYVTSLSESEMTAYYGSLNGTEEEIAAATTMEVDPETGEEYPVQNGNLGCYGKAQEEVNGDDITNSPKYWDAMQTYYEDLQQRVESDPRLVKLNEQWSSCMKKAGFDYATQQDFWEKGQADLQARADEVIGADFYKDPMEGWSQDKMDEFWASATQEEIDALYNQSRTLTPEQRTQLEAILADEVKIGLAEHTCSKDLNEKGQDIYAEIEETFALEHEDELKALAATLASGE
ncbi:MAG: hypothetical protein HGA51_02940 [Demequinaceae bacterium]|nr:hypothetical protein [Demequinaceae bacterium]